MSTTTTITDNEYVLLDSGNEQKLERVGEYTLVRPSPQAVWRPQLSETEWNRADAIYVRSSEGSGAWQWKRKIKREFDILFNNISFNIHLTDFGHLVCSRNKSTTGIGCARSCANGWCAPIIATCISSTSLPIRVAAP